MALVLRIENRKMALKAKELFIKAEHGNCEIMIPAMVLVEISYLSEGRKIKISLNDVEKYIQKYPSFKEYKMDREIIKSAFEINDIKELHDRLIAGTAKFLNLELITNDPIIIASGFVKTIWK